MKTWLRLLIGTIVLLVAIEASPAGQSFNVQIQAALAALGYVTSTSQFVQNSKGVLYPAGQYLNFGASYGAPGYGVRDNPASPGTMQFSNSGGPWTNFAASSGGGLATFIVQTADASVPNAQALSALATGIVFNTTTTGVLSTSLLLPAANFPALTGDVTTAGGALATTISAAAVTLAKIQNAAANSKLLGSGAAGSGAPYVELTLGAGLSMTGTTLASTAASIAGSNTQVQYNNSGAFGASSSFTWTQGSTLLTVAGTTNSTNVLVGNNTPSLTSPKSAAFALNQSWASAFSSTAFDGAQITTVWNTSGTATGQSESVLIQGSIQGSHAMTGDLYGLHVNLDDLSTGTLTETEASRNENNVETGATVTDLYGVTSVEKVASGGTSSLLREFYAYSPQVSGTLSTEGVEYFGDDPLGSGCTLCTSEFLYFGARGSLVVAPSPLEGAAAGHAASDLFMQNTFTSNADLASGANLVNFNADITPSATLGIAVTELSSYVTMHGTHQITSAVIGGFSGVQSLDSTSFTNTGTGLNGFQVEWDYGSSGNAALVTGLEIVAGEAGAGVITTGSEIWLQQPYATTGVVTNYAAIQIDNQTWPGSTTNYAILYNAPAGKTFAVVADGTVELAGVTYTWPATAGTSGYVLTTNGSGTLSWGSGIPFPAFAPAGTSTAPSYSWTTAHGVGLYEPSTTQTGIVGGVILGKTASAARGSELYISGSGIAPSAAPLEQLDLEPGLDTLQTLVVGQNGYGFYLNPVLSSSASGTNALIANAYFDAGTWTNGGATITEASTVYIKAAPSIGASKYALHVAAGLSSFGGGILTAPTVYASLPASPVAGMVFSISDSTTQTWGATVSGGGSDFALVVYDGANWTVAGK